MELDTYAAYTLSKDMSPEGAKVFFIVLGIFVVIMLLSAIFDKD